MLRNNETRKTIALLMSVVFGFIAIYGIIMDKVKFAEVMPIITMVIGYYFGKSTALDIPGKDYKDNK